MKNIFSDARVNNVKKLQFLLKLLKFYFKFTFNSNF